MTIVFMGWCTCSPHLAAHAAQEREVEWTPAAIRRPKKWTGCRGEGVHDKTGERGLGIALGFERRHRRPPLSWKQPLSPRRPLVPR